MKLVITSIGPASGGPAIRSTSANDVAIACIARRRSRSACTWSTAERKRALRKELGHAAASCQASASSCAMLRNSVVSSVPVSSVTVAPLALYLEKLSA